MFDPGNEFIEASWQEGSPRTFGVNMLFRRGEKREHEHIAAVFGVILACPTSRFMVMVEDREAYDAFGEFIREQGEELADGCHSMGGPAEPPPTSSKEGSACLFFAKDALPGPLDMVFLGKLESAPWPPPNAILMFKSGPFKSVEEALAAAKVKS